VSFDHSLLERISDGVWEIPRHGGMRVPGRVYADDSLMKHIRRERALDQVVNVAHLPGIVGRSLAMPDIHWGYGFPIGGVAATDPSEGGVISPGGVGYDINCGVRLLASSMESPDVEPLVKDLVAALFSDVPSGVGSSGAIGKLSGRELESVMVRGAAWAVEKGYGGGSDPDRTDEGGALSGADPSTVSRRAAKRGLDQVGTLGSGNHFIELGVVDEVFDESAARAFGLERGHVTLMIHSGSRGLGYQVCDDYLDVMQGAMSKYGIEVPDRQLACAPVESREGSDYLSAMACAANYAWANRQVMMSLAVGALERVMGESAASMGLRLVYDVCHNIAKMESHFGEGGERRLCVHRKGATRAFASGHADVPSVYRAVGQPVLVPGDMGRSSYVLVGTRKAMDETFGSCCHGAGRVLSRKRARSEARGRNIASELGERGVFVMATGKGTLKEEMPQAYKDVANVVGAAESAGIATRVARLRPMGVVKG